MTQRIKELCEQRARAGDAGFAIAYALLDLSESVDAQARAVDHLGFNSSGDEGHAKGVGEKLAMELERVADAISGLPINVR
jgi:hypothetical protein